MDKKVYILGPCSMENRTVFYETLIALKTIMGDQHDWWFKCSFDKANRTSLHGSRGPGLSYAINVWKEAKLKHPSIKFLTDVHECWQVEKLASVIDCIQIPAFLCRQTDLIVECAKYFDKINIKKGQWLGPNNLIKSVDKVKEINPDCEVWLCDRGSNFGYHELVVNFNIVDEIKKYYDKIILDCTHATQRSRAVYGLQGDSELAKRYFKAAFLFNYDGIFAETHPKPHTAISDADCQIPLGDMKDLVRFTKWIRTWDGRI